MCFEFKVIHYTRLVFIYLYCFIEFVQLHFVIINTKNITQNLDENIKNVQEIHQNNLEENDVQFCNTTNLDNELQNNLEENENNDEKI